MNGKHPNILDLYGAIKREQRVLIFMEYMDGKYIPYFHL
jgi:serine/threonine protein kinase